jgi:hypothetical protein
MIRDADFFEARKAVASISVVFVSRASGKGGEEKRNSNEKSSKSEESVSRRDGRRGLFDGDALGESIMK